MAGLSTLGLQGRIARGVLRLGDRPPILRSFAPQPRDAVANEPHRLFGLFNVRNAAALDVGIQVERRRLFHRPTLQQSLIAALFALLATLALADSGILPDPSLTPGAVRTTNIGEICSHGTRELRHWDRQRDDRIMAEYGLPSGPHPDWEIDHLIPLGIGGADDVANLWPEPRRSIELQWSAETKDRLEWKLRDLICSGQLDVAAAQRSIADDWTEAYGRFIHEPAPPYAARGESRGNRPE
jgi:hypothetical protein